ncbi:MAG: NAD-binding protein [SAR202 cluster bacterium]|nr:NAD-binding protein [SAR202 cluster bacterium]
MAGWGRSSSRLCEQALEEHSVPTTAIELDPQIVEGHREKGGIVVHGSSGSDTVLEAAHVPRNSWGSRPETRRPPT